MTNKSWTKVLSVWRDTKIPAHAGRNVCEKLGVGLTVLSARVQVWASTSEPGFTHLHRYLRAHRGQCLRLVHHGRENWAVPSPGTTTILAPPPSWRSLNQAHQPYPTWSRHIHVGSGTNNERASAASPLGPSSQYPCLSPATRTEVRKLTVSRCTSFLACTVLRVMSASDVCEMCGQAEDTLHHRIWVCTHPHEVAARARSAASELRREAVTAGATEPWFTRAIASDPSDLLPAPNLNDRAPNETILDQTDWQCGEGQLQAFSDGSCTQELCREVKRASRALSVHNQDGEILTGILPSLPRATTLCIDCRKVVHTWHISLEKQLG